MANAINWFEIPAAKFDRAVKFYSEVLATDMPAQEMMGNQMAFFPYADGSVSGAVVAGEGYVPSADGSLIFLNGGDNLDTPLSRVESAGGKVLMPKTKITDEIGYFAIFMDTEGNKVAFHSQA